MGSVLGRFARSGAAAERVDMANEYKGVVNA